MMFELDDRSPGCRGLGRVRPRALAVCIGTVALLSASDGLAATYQQELDQCVSSYLSANGGSFSCNICGVSGGCSGNDCHWGSLSANASSQSALGSMLDAGFQLFCVNHGGSMVASASPIAAQGAALDRAFRTGRGSGGSTQVGGLAEYSALTGGASSYGVALPFSYRSGQGSSDFDLAGTAIAGHSSLITQFGAAATPTYRSFPEGSAGSQRVIGLSVPLQLVMTTGSTINTSWIYHVGLGAMAGVAANEGLGFGAAVDAIYAGGIQIPVQLIGRWSTGNVVVQPGVSADAKAGGDIVSTLQQNVLVGLDTGQWILGVRVFRQGSDGWVFGLGATSSSGGVSGAVAAAAGHEADDAVDARPGDAGVRAVVVADVDGNPTASRAAADAVREAFRARRLAPLDADASERALRGATVEATIDARILDAMRVGAGAGLAVSIVAKTTQTGALGVVLTVSGHGAAGRRLLLVERGDLPAQVRRAMEELLSNLDVRGLQATPAPTGSLPGGPPAREPAPTLPPPAPVAPAPPPAPVAPAPSPVPAPAPARPAAGCAQDVDCEGDRLCVNGRCVAPP